MVMSSARSMRLFLVGATGKTGLALIDQALARGHRVTAFVRSPLKLVAREGLAIVKGDPLDAGDLGGALPGHDAVLSALGPPGPFATTIAADGARAMVAAMRATSLRRLLVVGVAVLFEHNGVLATLLRHTLLRNVADDSAGNGANRHGERFRLDHCASAAPHERPTHGSRMESVGKMPPGVASSRAISAAPTSHTSCSTMPSARRTFVKSSVSPIRRPRALWSGDFFRPRTEA